TPPATTPPATTPPATTPPNNPPGADSTWKFSPDSVTFDGPSQSVTVSIADTDPNGAPATATLPAGTQTEIIGEQDAVTVVPVSPGVFTLTSTGVIGSIVLGLRIPGQPLTASLSAMNVRLKSGVVSVPDSQILFPSPSLPYGGDPLADPPPGVSATGVGPFTWDQYKARIDIPADPGYQDVASGDPVFDPDMVLPWVFKGTAPAPGTELLGSGSSHIIGMVVNRGNGLDTIESGGYSLISVRLAALGDVYSDLKWDIDYDAMVAAGMVPDSYEKHYTCADDVAAADCPSLDDVPLVTKVDGALPAPDGQAGFGRARRLPTASAQTPSRAVATHAPTDAGGTCSAKWQTIFAELKFPSADLKVHPYLEANATLASNGDVDDVNFVVGYDANLQVGFGAKLQPAGSASLTCVLLDIGSLDAPTPSGPFAGIITFSVNSQLLGKAGLKIEGGPKLEGTATASFTQTLRIGFHARNGALNPVYQNDMTKDLTPSLKHSIGIDQNGVAADADLTFGFFANASGGLRAGGYASRAIGQILGDSRFGFFEVISAELGPRNHVVWENQLNALQNQTASSSAGTELVESAKYGGDQLDALFAKIRGPGGGSLVNVSQPSLTLPMSALFRALVPAGDAQPTYFVNNTTAVGVVKLRPGDTFSVKLPMGYPALVDPTTAPTADGGSAWLSPDSGIGFDDISDLFSFSLRDGGKTLEASTVVTGTWCPRLGDPLGKHHISFLATMEMFGILPAPGFAGTVDVQCVPARLTFQETAIEIDDAHANSTVVAHLVGSGAGGWQWTVDQDASGAPPAWLHLDPGHGTFADGQAPVVPINISVDCAAAGDQKVTYEVHGFASHAGQNAEPAALPITADCRNKYVEFTDNNLSTGPHDLALQSFGPVDADWVVASSLPGWVTISKSGGHLAVGLSQTPLHVVIAQRTAGCRVQPATTFIVHVTTTTTVAGTERGSATLRVGQPAVADVPCPHPTGNASGDPHLTTMDGARFDAQVLGEYWYLRPDTAGGEGPTVQVRQELTNNSGTTTSPATSVTGIAIKTSGHVIEAYSREGATHQLYVDGNPQALVDGVPLQITDRLSIVRTQTTLSVSDDDISASIVYDGSILDVTISTPSGTPVHGLLGSPDANQDDDTIGASVNGAAPITYTADQLRNNTDDDLHAFTDSWRLTDADRTNGNRLLSQDYAGFDSSDPALDSAALLPFEEEVIARLGSINEICSAPTGGSLSYTIAALALELSIGATLPTNLGQYTCRYTVFGTVTSGAGGPGLGGMNLVLDGPGLSPCTTTSNSNGEYMCTMTVALDELDGTPPPTPLPVSIVGTWPGSSTVVATGTATFASHAPLDGASATSQVDLTVDPASIPTLAVTGVMNGADAPLAGPVEVVIEVFKGAQTSTDYRDIILYDDARVTPSSVDGSYSLNQPLPFGTTHVRMTAVVGTEPSDFTVQIVNNIRLGLNPVVFDADYRPPIAQVAGFMIGNGGGLGPITVSVMPYDSNDQVLRASAYQIQVTPDPATGAYSFRQPLPTAAVRADVSTTVGPNRYAVSATGLVRGANDVRFDVDYRPATVVVTGTVKNATGGGVPGPLDLYVTAFDDNHNQVGGPGYQSISPAAADGSFTATVLLPSGATNVDVDLRVSNHSSDDFTVHVDHIAPGSTVTVPVTKVYAPGTLTVHGSVKQFGTVLTTGTVDVNVHDDATFYSATNRARVQPDGTYSATFVLPAGLTSVIAGSNITFSPEGSGAQIVPITEGASGGVEIDLDDFPVRVHVSGVMKAFGQVANQNFIFVRGREADGTFTSRDAFVTPNATDGSYSVDVLMPTGTSEASIQLDLAGPAHAGGGQVYLPADGQPTLPLDPHAVNNFTLSGDLSAVRINGTVLDGGQPDPAITQLDLDVQQLDADSNLRGDSQITIPVGADGTFLWNPDTTVYGTVVTKLVVTVSNLPGTAPAPHVIDMSTPGVHLDTWTIAVDDPEFYVVSGNIAEPPPASSYPYQLLVTSYAFDPANYNAAVPYTVLGTQTIDVPRDADGNYSVAFTVPPDSTLVTYDMLVRGADDGWTRAFRRTTGGPQAIEFDIDLTRRIFTLQGTVASKDEVDPNDNPTDVPCDIGSFLFRYTFVGFVDQPDTTTPPVQPETYNPETFPGAEIDDGILVVPDPSTKEYTVSLNVPDDDATYGFVVRDFNDINGPLYAVPDGFPSFDTDYQVFNIGSGQNITSGPIVETVDCPDRQP
ncbi:MAG: hypothetical protein JWM34_3927, partial [Ilumatobacteraceae bacterium]|nr:hypothetical protein [Ilumatobacteraceae bacterium]